MSTLKRLRVGIVYNWPVVLLSIIFFVFFVRLGYWQIERADEKRHMVNSAKFQANNGVVSWLSNLPKPKQYQRIKLNGEYLPYLLLLDNQHHEHQFGYHVISPYRLSDGGVVLVDRGWVVGDVTRQTIPLVETPIDVTSLTGSAYFPSSKNWLLGPGIEVKDDKVAIIEVIDINKLADFLHESLNPFIIRLDKEEPHGFIRDWSLIAMPPERHLAYAAQWFALALLVFVSCLVFMLRKNS